MAESDGELLHLMPTHLAARKWPSSCKKMTKPKPKTSENDVGWSVQRFRTLNASK